MKIAMLLLFVCAAGAARAQVQIDDSDRVPPDPRQSDARFVRFRPADGQVATLNPPRFSWPYLPQLPPKEKRFPGDMTYTLQISRTLNWQAPDVAVDAGRCNFYNLLPALHGARQWYWRVGYRRAGGEAQWSDVRTFTLAQNAVEWDRSGLRDLRPLLKGHPRILVNPANLAAIRGLRDTDPLAKELGDYIVAQADRALRSKRYAQFPRDDSKPMSYMQLGRSMVFVAFAHVLTGDPKYATVKERFLRMASWPKGGLSSPEGITRDKWSTHLTEYLGLFYDWFYHDMTDQERAVVRESLEWRIAHTTNNFAWMRRNGTRAFTGSIAVLCGSHPYENTMVTLPGALAIYEESAIARDAFHIGLNYLIGITNGMGEDQAWNEGPGYGNGKMKWLMDATCYLNTAVPELHLERNEVYSALGDFFARITPVGAAQHSSFGNRGLNERDWGGSRVNNFLRLALLRQDGRFLYNWQQTRGRLAEISKAKAKPFPHSPWVDYALLHYYPRPEPRVESDPVRLFALEGWVTANSAPPSDRAAQKRSVAMTFHCRPRGGYSHSFRNENAFDIHAYGSTIASGGGSTSNQSFFANHTMSHNTILVNGKEQLGSRGGARLCGRVAAFHRGPGLVYWSGDATPAYGPRTDLGRFIRHVLFLRGRYFVVFDDLAVRDGAKPATFQWLYHVYPAVELRRDPDSQAFRYSVGRTRVLVQHAAHMGDLTFEDLRGAKGMVNPVTGEDLTTGGKWNKDGRRKNPKPADANHLWIGHRTPQERMRFLAVIVPYLAEHEPPQVEPLDDTTVRVTFMGKTDVVAFAPRADADVVVDAAAIAKACEPAR